MKDFKRGCQILLLIMDGAKLLLKWQWTTGLPTGLRNQMLTKIPQVLHWYMVLSQVAFGMNINSINNDSNQFAVAIDTILAAMYAQLFKFDFGVSITFILFIRLLIVHWSHVTSHSSSIGVILFLRWILGNGLFIKSREKLWCFWETLAKSWLKIVRQQWDSDRRCHWMS